MPFPYLDVHLMVAPDDGDRAKDRVVMHSMIFDGLPQISPDQWLAHPATLDVLKGFANAIGKPFEEANHEAWRSPATTASLYVELTEN